MDCYLFFRINFIDILLKYFFLVLSVYFIKLLISRKLKFYKKYYCLKYRFILICIYKVFFF